MTTKEFILQSKSIFVSHFKKLFQRWYAHTHGNDVKSWWPWSLSSDNKSLMNSSLSNKKYLCEIWRNSVYVIVSKRGDSFFPYQWRSCGVKGQRFLGWAESLWSWRGFGWGCWELPGWQRWASHLEGLGPTLRRWSWSQRSHNVDWLGAIGCRTWSERQDLFAGVRKLGSEQRRYHKL